MIEVKIQKFIVTPVLSLYKDGKLEGEQQGQSLVYYISKHLDFDILAFNLEKELNEKISKVTTTNSSGRSSNRKDSGKV
jgi:hypothetical protein